MPDCFAGYIENGKKRATAEEEKMRRKLFCGANYDEELLTECRRCKELCFEYNRLSPAREDERRVLIRRQRGQSRHSRGRGGRRQSLPGDSPDCGSGRPREEAVGESR